MKRSRSLSSVSAGIVLVLMMASVFAILSVTVAIAEDALVHAGSPGYEIVVGKDVTFEWDETAWRNQDRAEVRTSFGDKTVHSSDEYLEWADFPLGTAWWEVHVWAPNSKIGHTSRQNFYHFNNIPNTTHYRLEPFEYKRGARDLEQTRDLSIFYELTKDYAIDLAACFTDLDRLPEPIDWDDEYDKTEQHRQDLYDYARGLGNIDSDFIKLDGGVLTLKQGYRWDGTSNPFVWEEEPSDLRSSCVHDAFYDLMRMDYLEWDDENHFNWEWNDPGYMNRLVADTLHFMIAVEDRDKAWDRAWSDWRTLRKLGRGKTSNDELLRPFKYHVSGFTAWVTDDGKIDLHWLPANKAEDDPKNYHILPHNYDIYRTTSNASQWTLIGNRAVSPIDMVLHTDATVYFTDPDVIDGEIYYYWIRVNDLDTDGDGWTDQEERDYGGGSDYWYKPAWWPPYNARHYDESVVEAVVSASGPGNALQLNGIDQFVISTTEPGASSGTSWTFEAWVYPEDPGESSTVIQLSGLYPYYPGEYRPLTYDGPNGRFCYSNSQKKECTTSGLINAYTWYHLAVTINGRNGVIYVNGEPALDFTADEWPETTPTIGIGASFDIDKIWDESGGEDSGGAWVYVIATSDHFKGKIDELRVWNVARSLAEIKANMHKPLRGDHPELFALWHFDEPDRTHTAYDATINGRDGEVHECVTSASSPKSSCFVSSSAMNMPPVALCVNVTLPTGPGTCHASTSVNNGSYDPDGDGITVLEDPPGPYGLGDTDVTLTVTDGWGAASSCTATVTVVDEEPPVGICNAPDTIMPSDAPISFTATATDNCDMSSVEITRYEFYKFTKKGKRIDKTEDGMADVAGDTIAIMDSGGINTHIAWNVIVSDNSGNTTGEACGTLVVNPGKNK